MNHTTNYQLNQWEAQDKVQRLDFNADNAKIDAAIKAVDARVDGLNGAKADKTELNAVRALAVRSRFTKLWEITLTEDKTTVELDMSAVDWARWDKVHLDAWPNIHQQALIYFNQMVDPQHYDLYISAQSDYFISRLTLYPGCRANRCVSVSFGDQWNAFGYPYSRLNKLVISGTTIGTGAQFILWGEE